MYVRSIMYQSVIMGDKLGRAMKENIVSYFKLLFLYSHRMIEETHVNTS